MISTINYSLKTGIECNWFRNVSGTIIYRLTLFCQKRFETVWMYSNPYLFLIGSTPSFHTLANCLLVQPAVRPSWRQECGRGSEGVRGIAKLHTLIPRARLLLIGPANSRALVMSRMQPRVRRRARNFKRETFLKALCNYYILQE